MSQINHVDKGSQFENRIVYRKQDCVDTRGLLQLYSPHHNMQSSTVASTLWLHRLAHVHSPGEKSLCTSPYHNIIELRPVLQVSRVDPLTQVSNQGQGTTKFSRPSSQHHPANRKYTEKSTASYIK